MPGFTISRLPEEVVFTPEEIEKVKAAIRKARLSMRDWNECRRISFEDMNRPMDAALLNQRRIGRR